MPPEQSPARWTRRRTAAVLVRVGAAPPGPSALAGAAWTVTTVALSVGAGLVASRSLRRLAPMAWLLRIDVAFPGDDRAAAERIVALAAALTAHDHGTRGHSERVRGYTRLIGQSMGIGREDLDRLAWAGLLHDVGKLAVDPDILNKPCRLDDHELHEVRQHPIEGARR